jgi:hypothetical protein
VAFIILSVFQDFSIWWLLLGDGARKLADGDQLMWKQTVLVRGE